MISQEPKDQHLSLWASEVAKYDDRIAELEKWNPAPPEELKKVLKGYHLDYTNYPKASIALRLALFSRQMLRSSAEQVAAFIVLWKAGLLGAITMPARMLIELWGASLFAKTVLEKLERTDDIEKAFDKIDRLIIGSRSDIDLPWGGKSEVKSYSVQYFIDRLIEDVDASWEQTYAFLCESCHPAFIRSSEWAMSRPAFHNLSNEKFKARFHANIEQTFAALEVASKQVVIAAGELIRATEPIVTEAVRKLTDTENFT